MIEDLIAFDLAGLVASGASAYLVPSGGDDTTQINNALTHFAPYVTPRITFGLGTFSFTSLSVTTTAEFVGSGEGTILRQAAGTNAHMFDCTTNGTRLRFQSLTIDGNQQNQTNDATHVYYGIHFDADAASATAPCRLEVTDVTFVNGRSRDIYTRKATNESSTSQFLVNVSNCRFLGGVEAAADNSFGAGYVALDGGPSLKAVNNLFDFQGAPTVGRAGITTDGSGVFSKLIISNNEFRNVGTSSASGTIGNIDSHSGATDITITGNQLINPFGRGIGIKTDSGATTITGNIVDGLTAAGGVTVDAQIVVNRLVHNALAGQCVIGNNTLTNAAQDAISISGGSTLGPGAANDYNVTGNIILTPGRRGVGLNGVGTAKVANNTIDTPGGDGIFSSNGAGAVTMNDNTVTTPGANGIDFDGTNGSADVTLVDNRIVSATGRGIFIGSALGGLITGNSISDAGNTAAIQVQNTTQLCLVTGNRARGTNALFLDGGTNTKLVVRSNGFESDGSSGIVAVKFDTHANRLASTPFAGQQWKESDTGLVYHYDGAAWQILQAEGQILKTSIQTVNNSNILVNDTALFFPIEVNEQWYVEAILQAQGASVNADFAVGWSVPTGCTMSWGVVASGMFVGVTVASTPTALKTTGSGGAFGALAGTTAVIVAGWFTADAAHAGTVNFQWAQSTATAENNSILAGSILRLRRLA